MKQYQIKLSNGHVVEVSADDIRFVGSNVCKIVGRNSVPIYKVDEVRNITARGKAHVSS